MESDKPKPAERMAALLKDETLPRLVAEGAFGEGWRVAGLKVAPIGGLGEDHWASTTLATTLDLSQAGGSDKRTVALVSKFMLPGDGFEGFMQADVQAENEIVMYNKVFPFFDRLVEGTVVSADDLHPKCYLAGRMEEGATCLTLMENLRSKGFRMAESRAALDRAHVVLVLRALGRLHALSHAAKARCRDDFLEKLTPLLRECCYVPASREKWREAMRPTFRRGLLRLRERLAKPQDGDADADRHRRRLEGLRRLEHMSDDVYAIMAAAAARTEPGGVLVHGDFCRNNMQFRYVDGRPVEVRFFDFQNSRYASPAVDLSFFLFLNTSAELRAEQWDALLQEYFGSLKATLDALLEGHTVHEDYVEPTMEGLRRELHKHALWGYAISAFFLPQMMAAPEELIAIDDIKSMVTEDTSAAMDMMAKMGGEKATELLADMVVEFLDRDLVP